MTRNSAPSPTTSAPSFSAATEKAAETGIRRTLCANHIRQSQSRRPRRPGPSPGTKGFTPVKLVGQAGPSDRAGSWADSESAWSSRGGSAKNAS